MKQKFCRMGLISVVFMMLLSNFVNILPAFAMGEINEPVNNKDLVQNVNYDLQEAGIFDAPSLDVECWSVAPASDEATQVRTEEELNDALENDEISEILFMDDIEVLNDIHATRFADVKIDLNGFSLKANFFNLLSDSEELHSMLTLDSFGKVEITNGEIVYYGDSSVVDLGQDINTQGFSIEEYYAIDGAELSALEFFTYTDGVVLIDGVDIDSYVSGIRLNGNTEMKFKGNIRNAIIGIIITPRDRVSLSLLDGEQDEGDYDGDYDGLEESQESKVLIGCCNGKTSATINSKLAGIMNMGASMQISSEVTSFLPLISFGGTEIDIDSDMKVKTDEEMTGSFLEAFLWSMGEEEIQGLDEIINQVRGRSVTILVGPATNGRNVRKYPIVNIYGGTYESGKAGSPIIQTLYSLARSDFVREILEKMIEIMEQGEDVEVSVEDLLEMIISDISVAPSGEVFNIYGGLFATSDSDDNYNPARRVFGGEPEQYNIVDGAFIGDISSVLRPEQKILQRRTNLFGVEYFVLGEGEYNEILGPVLYEDDDEIVKVPDTGENYRKSVLSLASNIMPWVGVSIVVLTITGVILYRRKQIRKIMF